MEVSVSKGINTAYGNAGYINDLTVEDYAVFFINPIAGSNIPESGYISKRAPDGNPLILRTLVEVGSIRGELAIAVNLDENSYGQLVTAGFGATENSTFTLVIQGYGATAGKLILAASPYSALGTSLKFSKINVLGQDYKLILLSTPEKDTVNKHSYFGEFAVIQYFDFDKELRTLDSNQSGAAKLLSQARKDGTANADLVDSLTRVTAPSADPSGEHGRLIFDKLSGVFIATVLKQSAMNNTEGLYASITVYR